MAAQRSRLPPFQRRESAVCDSAFQISRLESGSLRWNFRDTQTEFWKPTSPRQYCIRTQQDCPSQHKGNEAKFTSQWDYANRFFPTNFSFTPPTTSSIIRETLVRGIRTAQGSGGISVIRAVGHYSGVANRVSIIITLLRNFYVNPVRHLQNGTCVKRR